MCLLGRNGVGKTTTMRAIMGLTPPTAGTRRLEGPGHRRLAAVPHRARRHRLRARGPAHLRRAHGAGEPRRRAPRRRRAGPWTFDAVFALFPKLRELADRHGGFLSGGEQQMLTIGRTLMGNPELLLLDEPSEGLAPLVVENLLEQVGRLKREGLTILLAEQGVDFSLALADRVYVLEKGAVVFRTGRGAARRSAPARGTARLVVRRI